MKKQAPSLEKFLKNIYGMSVADYFSANEMKQKAIDIDYWNRYGHDPYRIYETPLNDNYNE